MTRGEKISIAKKGIPLSQKNRDGLKLYWESKKGMPSKRKNGKDIACPICGLVVHKSKSRILRVKSSFCSKKCAYLSFKGQHHSPATELKRGINSGKNHYHWKGGITPEHQQIRGSFRYRKWQDKVKQRDGECQNCGDHRMSYLMVHHIQNFAEYPKLRFLMKNGITFCRPCHKLFHHEYGYRKNTREQLKKWLVDNSQMWKLKV